MAEDLRTWDSWHKAHQPFELAWWKEALKKGHSADPGFTEQWAQVRDFIKPEGAILDIGCGPRPPFAPCSVIEPLALAYKEITPPDWWNGVTVAAQPAEQVIDWWKWSFDTVIIWNAIDHAIGWKQILDNARGYMKLEGKLAIATDFQDPFLGHPGVPKDEFLAYIGEHFEVLDRREPFGRDLAMVLRRR